MLVRAALICGFLLATVPVSARAEYLKAGNVFIWSGPEAQAPQYRGQQDFVHESDKPNFFADEAAQDRTIRGKSPCRCADILNGLFIDSQGIGKAQAKFDAEIRFVPEAVRSDLEQHFELVKREYSSTNNDEKAQLSDQIRLDTNRISQKLNSICDGSGLFAHVDKKPKYDNKWKPTKPLQGIVEGTAYGGDDTPKIRKAPPLVGGSIYDAGKLTSEITDTGQCRCVRIPWKQWQDNLHSFVFNGLEQYLNTLPVGTDVVVRTRINADGSIDPRETWWIRKDRNTSAENAGQMIAEAVTRNLKTHQSLLKFPEPQIRQRHPELTTCRTYTISWTRLDTAPFRAKSIATLDLDEEVILNPGEPNPIVFLPCQRQGAPQVIPPSVAPQVVPQVAPPIAPAPSWRPQPKFGGDSQSLPGPGLYKKKFSQ